MPLNIGSRLSWVSPTPGRHYYELRDGDNTLASLEWKDPRGPAAEGMAGERRILFTRTGFFFHHTVISEADTGFRIGAFQYYGGDKGTLTFGDGYRLKWKFEGIPESKWFFTTDKGGELLCFTVPKPKKGAAIRTAAEVEVLRQVDERSIVLLATVGWYNIHGILSMA